MPELAMTTVKYVVMATVFAAMFGLGLNIAVSDFKLFRERPGLILRSFLVVTILVPAAAVLIDLVFQPARPIMVALAIMAASPAAPLALGKMRATSGSLIYAANLQLLVALLAPVTAPLILWILHRILAFDASLDPMAVAKQVFVAQFMPIGLGVLLRARFPGLAPFGLKLVRFAGLALLAVVLLILVFVYKFYLGLDLVSYAAIIAFIASTLALGHFLGPTDPGMRACLAVEATMRNPGLAMLIANLNIPTAHPVEVLVPCITLTVLAVTLYGKWQSRRGAADAAPKR